MATPNTISTAKHNNSSSQGCLLPDDLIHNILLQLPVKSLIRFKSVCKYWKSLITDHKFTIAHSRLPTHNFPSFLVVRSDKTLFSLSITVNPYSNTTNEDVKGKFVALPSNIMLEDGFFIPLGSCQGILCIYSFDNNKTRNIYLWNVATNVCRCIKSPPEKSGYYRVLKSGFGYVSSIDDYKILLVTGYGYDTSTVIQTVHVYSLRNDEWRELDVNTMNFLREILVQDYNSWNHPRAVDQVVLNEALHWVVDSIVIKFDLVTETFEILSNLIQTEDNIFLLCRQEFLAYDKIETWTFYHRNYWNFCFRYSRHFRYMVDSHMLLGITGNGRVVVMEERGTNMENLVIVDARQDPPLFVQCSNEYCAPYESDGHVTDVGSYFQTLISPFCI